MTDAAPRRYDFRVVRLNLIDPPPVAMREKMDDRGLERLAADIKRNGVLQWLGLVPTDDGRFRISWGHRRYEAAKLAGEYDVPARIVDDEAKEEEFKVAENAHQEPVNPMAEATYYAHLLEDKFGSDIDKLSAALNVPVSTINGRLDLLRGDPLIMHALRAETIKLGVARELNRMQDPGWRKYRLEEAIAQGATERVVREWRIRDAQTLAVQRAEASGEISATPPSTEAPIGSVDTCVLCLLPDDPNDMTYVKAHNDCIKRLIRAVRAEERQRARDEHERRTDL